MFVNTFLRRVLFNFALFLLLLAISLFLFYPVYTSDTVIISFAIHPFNICEKYPEVWQNLKLFYLPISFFAYLIAINTFYSSFFTKPPRKKQKTPSSQDNLSLLISCDKQGEPVVLPEASLYQNILVTGTIGSGKTSCAMYPFTRQLIGYHHQDVFSKLGMLILDVKGNYYSQVQKYASFYQREEDLIVIELRRKNQIQSS